MIVYHGTTRRRAQRIAGEGFLPRKPSRRVWFAASRGYALGRAKAQARRAHDRPVVLVCDLDLARLRDRLGKRKVRHRNSIIAIDGPVSADVLRSTGEPLDHPGTPKELADWINRVLGLKPYKGVGQSHPGILRLSRWVANRTQHQSRRGVRRAELLHVARQWLPEFFRGVEIDPGNLHVFRSVNLAAEDGVEDEPAPPTDPREDEALALLEDERAKARARGLKLLADLGDPDLFDWCAMYLGDEAVSVRLAALQTMACCEDGEADVIEPFSRSQDKRIRAAAIAALTLHAGDDAERWFERGLKDPSPCVRLATAARLDRLDPARHRAIFHLALHDPNPKVEQFAAKLAVGKGYGRPTYRRDEAL
jgi:hypothetical protein